MDVASPHSQADAQAVFDALPPAHHTSRYPSLPARDLVRTKVHGVRRSDMLGLWLSAPCRF